MCVAMVLLCALRLRAQATLPSDFAPELPTIPNATFHVMDYGAVPDGKTMNTSALQGAIDACSKAGGGTVLVPKGTYLTAPLHLASRLNLHLDAGATILMTDNPADFKTTSNRRLANCITAADCHDLEITGDGTIDGNGASFWKTFRAAQTQPAELQPPHRPMLIVIQRCNRLLVRGVTLKDSPMFHLVPQMCREVTIDSIHILAPQFSPNTDGIDPSGIDYLIEHCTIDNGDDNIALKPGIRIDPNRAACENFLVTDCTFGHGHGMSIGSGSAGGVENLLVRNCTFTGTDAGIRLKSFRGRGGLAEHLTYENLDMKDVKVAILITSYYPRIPADPQNDPAQPVNERTPIWRHILIKDVTASGGQTAARIVGLAEMPISDLTMENVHITAEKPMQMVYADDVHMIDSSIEADDGTPPAIIDAKIEEQK